MFNEYWVCPASPGPNTNELAAMAAEAMVRDELLGRYEARVRAGCHRCMSPLGNDARAVRWPEVYGDPEARPYCGPCWQEIQNKT